MYDTTATHSSKVAIAAGVAVPLDLAATPMTVPPNIAHALFCRVVGQMATQPPDDDDEDVGGFGDDADFTGFSDEDGEHVAASDAMFTSVEAAAAAEATRVSAEAAAALSSALAKDRATANQLAAEFGENGTRNGTARSEFKFSNSDTEWQSNLAAAISNDRQNVGILLRPEYPCFHFNLCGVAAFGFLGLKGIQV
jgi:hypothetical protein